MKRAILLAKKGLSWTNPNPLVGAVIVKNGKVIGEGFHHKVGLAHGEIEALSSLKMSAKGATMYVNLEPCVHTDKRTPPCTESIIKSGIKKVICATLDPNPKVNGLGVKRLEEAGIEVSVGLMEKEARQLNETYFTFHTKKRPFIALKFASSLDGKIATYTGESKWITNDDARKYARQLRFNFQAVLVGINTVLKDDPHLGVRSKGKKDPLRIVLGSNLKIPLTAQVLRDNNILAEEHISIEKLLKKLYKRGIISVLVEGGSEVLGSFIDSKLVDKVYVFLAPIIIGGKDAKTSVSGQGVSEIKDALQLRGISFKKFDSDFLITGYPTLA